MKKRYKLIYEDDDKLKGSYSGIPAKDDPALIDVAVLDGSEPVKPEPKPEPEPAPEPIDNAASIHALKEALDRVALSDGTGESINEEFKFDHCSLRLFRDMWRIIDAEAVEKFIGETQDVEAGIRFYLKHEGVVSTRIDSLFEATSENSADIGSVAGSLDYRISIETDTEDPQVVVFVPNGSEDFEFTGKVILRYPGE